VSVTVARLRAEKPAARSSVFSYPSGHQFTPPLRPREFAARVDGQRFYEPPKRVDIVANGDPNHAPMPGLKLTALRGVKMLGAVRLGETVRLCVQRRTRFMTMSSDEIPANSNPSLVSPFIVKFR